MALVAPDRSSERPDGVIGPESSPTAPVVEVSGLHVSFERGGRPVRAIRGVDLVIGRVERVHIADEVILADGTLDVVKMQPIARLGYYDYTVINNVFEMTPPDCKPHDGFGGTLHPDAGLVLPRLLVLSENIGKVLYREIR